MPLFSGNMWRQQSAPDRLGYMADPSKPPICRLSFNPCEFSSPFSVSFVLDPSIRVFDVCVGFVQLVSFYLLPTAVKTVIMCINTLFEYNNLVCRVFRGNSDP